MLTIDEVIEFRIKAFDAGLISPVNSLSEDYIFRTGYYDFSTPKNLVIVYELLELSRNSCSRELYVLLDSVADKKTLMLPHVEFYNARHPFYQSRSKSPDSITLRKLLNCNNFNTDIFPCE